MSRQIQDLETSGGRPTCYFNLLRATFNPVLLFSCLVVFAFSHCSSCSEVTTTGDGNSEEQISEQGEHDGNDVADQVPEVFEEVEQEERTIATWAKSYGGSSYDAATVIHELPDGGCFVAGDFGRVSEFLSSIWVLQLTSGGEVLLQNRYSTPGNDWVYEISATSDHELMIAGAHDSETEPSGFCYLMKIEYSGSVSWSKRTANEAAHYCLVSIDRTGDGGCISAGHKGSVTSPGFVLGDIWVVRLDTNGTIAWQKS